MLICYEGCGEVKPFTKEKQRVDGWIQTKARIAEIGKRPLHLSPPNKLYPIKNTVHLETFLERRKVHVMSMYACANIN